MFITHDLGVVARIADRVQVMYAGRAVERGEVRRLFTRPTHPYTNGLLASLPAIGRERLTPIPGAPPNMLAPPSGCAFRARCAFADEACAGDIPELQPFGVVETACIRAEELLDVAVGDARDSGGQRRRARCPVGESSDLVKVFPVRQSAGLPRPQGGRAGGLRRLLLRSTGGQTLGLVGESGSGKSTVGRCVLQLLEPSAGSVKYDGIELVGMSRKRPAAAAPGDADGLPGPVCLARSRG